MTRENALAGGIFGTIVAVVVDLLAAGGDTLFALAMLLLTDVSLFVTLFAQLQRLAPNVAWLNESLMNRLYLAFVGLFVLVILWRIAKSYQKRREES